MFLTCPLAGIFDSASLEFHLVGHGTALVLSLVRGDSLVGDGGMVGSHVGVRLCPCSVLDD